MNQGSPTEIQSERSLQAAFRLQKQQHDPCDGRPLKPAAADACATLCQRGHFTLVLAASSARQIVSDLTSFPATCAVLAAPGVPALAHPEAPPQLPSQ